VSTPLISIVIPAYNSRRTILECVRACQRQTLVPLEIIVVDDGSPDGPYPELDGLDRVAVIHQENAGPAAARNCGAAVARGEIIAFTDADCIPEPIWLESLVRVLESDTSAVAVGGTYGIANPGSWLARAVHEEIRDRHARFGPIVDFLGSFNLGVRKKAFEQVSGFDPAFTHASGEDNDLSYRLHDTGGILRFTQDAVVNHHHPDRLGPYLRTQARHGYWRMFLYAKHPARARGDRYAGPADLLAPLLALAAPVTFPLLVALHLPQALRMEKCAGESGLAGFAVIQALRDIARAAGLVAGVVRFRPGL
jgi:GT2 family glycosyltransferase